VAAKDLDGPREPGPIAKAVGGLAILWRVFREGDHRQVPDLWWPADRSWCLATDPDFQWLYVGGTSEYIEEITSSTEIEALRTTPDHRSYWIGSDLINDPNGDTVPESLKR
jgi:hypothetical protein